MATQLEKHVQTHACMQVYAHGAFVRARTRIRVQGITTKKLPQNTQIAERHKMRDESIDFKTQLN